MTNQIKKIIEDQCITYQNELFDKNLAQEYENENLPPVPNGLYELVDNDENQIINDK